MPTKKEDVSATIQIAEIQQGTIVAFVVGTTPLILNKMSKKVQEGLLAGAGKKTAAEKQSQLKHDPFREFTDSAHTVSDPDFPTYLAFPSPGCKRGMATAALDLPGAKKAQIGRLVRVLGEYMPIWGVPQFRMCVVRSGDINHTPDIRSVVIVPRWCSRVTIQYVSPNLRATDVANLLSASGVLCGWGDGRVEKGKLDYGCFQVVNENDPAWTAIAGEGGRDAQIAAMKNPEFYDDEARELFEWWEQQAKARGFKVTREAA